MKSSVLVLAAVALLAPLSACQKKPAEGAAAPSLSPEWRVPDVYQGEWRVKAEDCGKTDDPAKLVLSADTVEFDGASGKVMASSVQNEQLTLILELTKDDTTWRRVYAFRLSPDLTTLTEVVTDADSGPGAGPLSGGQELAFEESRAVSGAFDISGQGRPCDQKFWQDRRHFGRLGLRR